MAKQLREYKDFGKLNVEVKSKRFLKIFTCILTLVAFVLWLFTPQKDKFQDMSYLLFCVVLLLLFLMYAYSLFRGSKKVSFYKKGLIITMNMMKKEIHVAYDEINYVKVYDSLFKARVEIYFKDIDTPMKVLGDGYPPAFFDAFRTYTKTK